MKKILLYFFLLTILFININAQYSEYCKEIISNIEDTINVSVFYSEDLPSPYNEIRTYLNFLLNDFNNLSNNKIQFNFINPTYNIETENEVHEYGIQMLNLRDVRNGKDQIIKAYTGIVFFNKNRTEIISYITKKENIDFQIAQAIKRVTQKNKSKIGIVCGGIFPAFTEFTILNESITKYYEFIPVDSSNNYNIGNDMKALLVFSPKLRKDTKMQDEILPEQLLLNLDQFIMNGGRVVFLLDKVLITKKKDTTFAESVTTGLENILVHYGLKINDSFIADKECALVSVAVQKDPSPIYEQMPFPYYPRISQINKDIPFLFNLQNLYLGFTNDIDIGIATEKGINVIPLIYTSDKSKIIKSKIRIGSLPKVLPDSMFNSKRLLIGACYEGEFESYFADKNIKINNISLEKSSLKLKSTLTKLILLGNGKFIKNEFMGPPENINFIMGIIDYIVE